MLNCSYCSSYHWIILNKYLSPFSFILVFVCMCFLVGMLEIWGPWSLKPCLKTPCCFEGYFNAFFLHRFYYFKKSISFLIACIVKFSPCLLTAQRLGGYPFMATCATRRCMKYRSVKGWIVACVPLNPGRL